MMSVRQAEMHPFYVRGKLMVSKVDVLQYNVYYYYYQSSESHACTCASFAILLHTNLLC